MLPGRTYTPSDFVGIVWRHKWVIVIPFVVLASLTFAVTYMMVDEFRAETVIAVVPQRVPDTYVKSTVTNKIEDRLQTISSVILARTRLEKIIEDFNLYAEERRVQIMEDVVAQMRRNVQIDVVKGDTFRVSFIGRDPRTVMKVTDRLATLFMDENLRDREQLAEGTNQFLESQLEEARRRLVEQEQKVAAYERQNAGTLPTQSGANLQVLGNTQMQIQALLESINRDRDQKGADARALADLNLSATVEADSPTPALPARPAAGNSTGSEDLSAITGRTLRDQLTSAREQLAALELRLKPEHPDVIRMRRAVADLQQKADAAALQVPVSSSSPFSAASTGAAAPMSATQRARINQAQQLESEMQNLDTQIATKEAEVARLRKVAAEYQLRVETVPMRQAEMTELTRDYAVLQNLYQSLLSKKEESQISANLERRQVGEQFKLLDPAQLPQKPYSPDRLRLNLIGAALGLALGIGLAAFQEFKDSSFRTDGDVTSVLQLPVLARIPLMMNQFEVRQMRRRRIAISVAAVAIVVLAGASWKLGVIPLQSIQRLVR